MNRKGKTVSFILLILGLMLTACGGTGASTSGTVNADDSPYVAARPGEYDSADTAVITKVSELTKSITFYNCDLEKSYTLSYDSVTKFTDKYGTAISVSELTQGTMADVLFLKSGKLIAKLSENAECFVIPEVTGFSIDAGAKVFNYKSDSYKITDSTILLSDNSKISIEDLDPIDEVTIVGFDNEILSVTVNKSHGELSLKGSEDLTGGFLEIGSKQIEEITPNFKITMQEGTYDVKVSKGKTEALKTVEIKAGEETVLDLSDVEIEKTKTGRVYFDVTPDTADVYVDGKLIDTTELQTFEYGRHELTASADGYESVEKTFNVGEDNATLLVALEETAEDDDSDSDTTSTDTDSSNTDGYYVFITQPSGVEVTWDGNYVGITPLSLNKKAGTHTIGLRKNGCVSRTYTVSIENTAKDVYYTFEDLEESTSVSSNE